MLEIVLPGYLYVGAVVGLIVKMMVKYLIVLNDKTNTLLSLKKKKTSFFWVSRNSAKGSSSENDVKILGWKNEFFFFFPTSICE